MLILDPYQRFHRQGSEERWTAFMDSEELSTKSDQNADFV